MYLNLLNNTVSIHEIAQISKYSFHSCLALLHFHPKKTIQNRTADKNIKKHHKEK